MTTADRILRALTWAALVLNVHWWPESRWAANLDEEQLMSGDREVVTPGPMTTDGLVDEQNRHVLVGTAANGEPVIVRVPCGDGCQVCAAITAYREATP